MNDNLIKVTVQVRGHSVSHEIDLIEMQQICTSNGYDFHSALALAAENLARTLTKGLLRDTTEINSNLNRMLKND